MRAEMLWAKAKIECLKFSDCKYLEYHLYHSDLINEDGYPTEQAQEIIKRWGWWHGRAELFEFIKGLWHLASWGWHEEKKDGIIEYHISTAGWSGNEGLIGAMQNNRWMLWSMTWVQSRRGGHYIFEVKHEA
jgi:hypothetical protein